MQNKMKSSKFLLFLGLTIFLLFAARAGVAQSTAILAGTVADTTGAVVPDATVQCVNSATGISHTATTDSGGLFRFPDLPVGSYNLTVSHGGFATSKQEGIVLVTGHNVDIPVQLTVGGTTQSVDVAGITQGVQPTSSEVQTSIENKSMEDLPLNGRNALQLVFLSPGAISQSDAASFQSANTRVSVNGNRGTDNGYELDGVNYIDTHYGTAPILPSPDAIQEFTAKTSNFDAQQPGAGANIQFTTRSGTNHIHGSVFEYVRNNYFDARNYFANTTTPFKRNQFGGVVGGPVLRDKTFFFFSYQGTRTVGGANPSVVQVPSQAFLNGDFSGSSNTIVDPQTGLPFKNNKITSDRFDPVTAKLLSYYPAANQPDGTTYVSNPRNNQNDDQFLGRIDHELTSKDHLVARFFYDKFSFQTPSSGLPAFYGEDEFYNRNGVLSDTHTFSPNLLVSGAFGYTSSGREQVGIQPITAQGAGAKVTPAAVGAPDEITISVTGFAPLTSGAPTVISPKTFEYRGRVSWAHGKHFIQFGADVIRNLEYANNPAFELGQWAFDGSRTASSSIPKSGNAVADFLLGLPLTFYQHATSQQTIHETKVEPWFQDDWKVTKRLTLNLGVRWQPWFPAVDREAPQIGFEAGVQSTVAPGAPLGLVFSGDNGLPHAIFATDWNNVAPRIGFAYDVNGDARTVVRGSYGIFFRPSPLNLQRFSGNTAAFRSLAITLSDPPSFENPYSNTPGGTPFPWTVPQASDLHSYVFTKPVTTSALIPHSATSYVQEWNLTAEHQVTRDTAISLSYIGNHMIKGMDSTEGNPATYIPGASTQANADSRRPYKGISTMQILAPFQFSNYNAMQVTANKRAASGLTLISNYTWSKCMDNDSQSTGTVTVINKFDLRANYAPCDFNIGQVANISVVYDLPTVHRFKGIADRVLNHWQLSTIMGLQGADVYSIKSGVANSLTGPTTNSGTLDLADRVPGVSVAAPAGASNLKEYFNTAAFTANALGTFGNSGRNSMRGRGVWKWDMGILKTVPLTERVTFTLRGEAFNFLNRTQFSDPVSTLNNAKFGQTITAGDPRVLQISGRVTF